MNPSTVLHIPHSSTAIPPDIRATLSLSDGQLDVELLALTDHLTDRLFTISETVAVRVTYQWSRLVVDPERFPDDDSEPMATRGMGAVYRLTSRGDPLRPDLTFEEREALLARFYRPHHERLTAAVSDILDRRGACLILDCHSFPSQAQPFELDPAAPRPDIDLGTDPFHTPVWLLKHAQTLFSRAGFTLAVNRPYAGTMVPATFYRTRPEVVSLMIEVNRSLYLDEATGMPGPAFAVVASGVQSALGQLAIDYAARLRA